MNKSLTYDMLLLKVVTLLQNETDMIANLSNLSALLNENLPEINWVGFYLIKNDELVLGPFQGKVACTRIKLGYGVCGKSALLKTPLRVSNVHEFDGHIACDSASNSEIVIPLTVNHQVIGVLDIDSYVFDRFDAVDQMYLERIVNELEKTL
ncbi:MAG: GAF domain-containing protein [Clostridia bacterium]|nr:GAF domain-containing protein [Clostridia bacterium]